MLDSFNNKGTGRFDAHACSRTTLLPFANDKSLLEVQTESGHSCANSKSVFITVLLPYNPILDRERETSMTSSRFIRTQLPSIWAYSCFHLKARIMFKLAPSLIFASTLLSARVKVSIHSSPSKVSSPLLRGTNARWKAGRPEIFNVSKI